MDRKNVVSTLLLVAIFLVVYDIRAHYQKSENAQVCNCPCLSEKSGGGDNQVNPEHSKDILQTGDKENETEIKEDALQQSDDKITPQDSWNPFDLDTSDMAHILLAIFIVISVKNIVAESENKK